jgi:hypothetical protein
MTKAQMFLQASQPDSDGKTRLWLYSELETLYPGVEFQTKNGGDWNRSDGQLRDFIVYREKDKNRTIGIRLDGYKETSIQKRIRTDIFKAIRKERCRVVDVGGENIECDHKDGRYTSDTYNSIENQNEDDFQPLLRNVNLSKRTHCKACQETNERYDAKRLGYSFGWISGESVYAGTCVGCYWYDPKQFNKVISKEYKP